MGTPWRHWKAGPMQIQPAYSSYYGPAYGNTPYAPGYDGYPHAESSQQGGKGKKAMPHPTKEGVKVFLEGITNHERGYQENMASMQELEQVKEYSTNNDFTPVITQVLSERMSQGWPRNYKALDVVHYLQSECSLPPLPHLLDRVMFLHYTPIDHPRGAASLLRAKTGQILEGWGMETLPPPNAGYGQLGVAGGRLPGGMDGDWGRAVSLGGPLHSQTFARAVGDSLRSASSPTYWPSQSTAPAWDQQAHTYTTTTVSVGAPVDEHLRQHLYKVESDRLAARGW